jgi:2-haloacid dehalogenase
MPTIAFDIYGTLINPLAVGSLLTGIIGEKAPAFNALWRDKQLEYSFRKAAMKQFNHFSECTEMALRYCDQVFNTAMTTNEIADLLSAYRRLPAYDDTRVCLSKLKGNEIEIIAFSNGKKSDLIDLFRHAGIIDYFDQIVSVDEVQIFKPAPEVYHLLADRSSSDLTNTTLVSANAFDIIGAGAVGLSTIWLKRDPKMVFDPFGYTPDKTIKSLTEL